MSRGKAAELEHPPNPSGKKGLKAVAAAAMVTAASGLGIGLFEGLGSSIAPSILSIFAPETEANALDTPAQSAVENESIENRMSPPAEPTTAHLDDGTAAAGIEIVRLRTTLDFGASMTAATEALACKKAIEKAVGLASRQCENIAIENGGGFRLEDIGQQCRSCGPVGGSWRCIANVQPSCVVMGE